MGFQRIIHSTDTEQPAIVLLIIVTGPICIAATVLRFVAAKRGHKNQGWENWFAVLALLAYLVYASIAVAGFIIADGTPPLEFDIKTAIKTSKLAYAASSFFETNQFFAKASIFALYYRIFSVDRRFVVWASVIAVIQICWYITFFWCLIFLCVPVSKWWDIFGTEPGWCMNDTALLVAEETINSAIDFAMVGLSIWLVQALNMKRSTKRKLGVLFALGGVSGILGFVKIGEVYGTHDANGKSNVSNGFWDLLQMATSIICCCAPVYKSLLPKTGFWTRLRSQISSYTLTARTGSTSKATHSGSGMSGAKKSEVWLHHEQGDSTKGFTLTEIETESPRPSVPNSNRGRNAYQEIEIV